MASKNNHPIDNHDFDINDFINAAASQLRDGKPLSSSDGILAPLIKKIIEKALDTELEEHLGYAKNGKSINGNMRNGKSKKMVKTPYGNLDIETGRDRDSSFEPKTLKKRETYLNKEILDKILSLYTLGMSYADIQEHLRELYTVDVSSSTITEITNSIIPEITSWQNRPLDNVYPFIFMDAIFYKVREDGKVVSKAVYVVLGITQEGLKEVLGLYFNESEGASFW